MITSFLPLFLLALSTPTEDAERLYREGTVKFEAADYNGAIEDFMSALAIVLDQNEEDQVRLALLYNIARAHEKAFKLDRDVLHLRQAMTLYRKYLEFTQETGDLGDEIDVEAKIRHLEKQLAVHSQIERNRSENKNSTTPPPVSTLNPEDNDLGWKKPRKLGVGLVLSGSPLTLGGIVLASIGSQLEPRAENEVAKLADAGIPNDHPAWAEGEAFIAQEKRKGNILMGIGVPLAVVGAVGVGVGVYYLAKAKKLHKESLNVRPLLSFEVAGVQVSGSF